jgi:hypothetical protein
MISVSLSFRATDEGKTMAISRTLELGCHAPIHLSRLELREQLVHRQNVILLRLDNGLELSALDCTIQRV